MSMKKVGSIEIYELDENLDKYTRKEREEYINELFKQEYQGKEISYLLNGEEIKALINKTTRKNFTQLRHSHGQLETFNEFKKRQDIAFSNDFIPLISNANFKRQSLEHYAGQSDSHRQNNHWYYFNKIIFCNDNLYNVIIDILERNGNYYIYNTKLKEVDARALNPGMISTSSTNNIH